MIRRAVSGDAAGLTAVAHAAKRHWGYPESWIALWERELTVSAELTSVGANTPVTLPGACDHPISR